MTTRILITGAGSGIGAAIARRIAAPGKALLLHTGSNAAGHAATSRETMESAAAITPNRRIGTPEDVAAMAAYLLSDDARHVTGQTLHIDGGLTL